MSTAQLLTQLTSLSDSLKQTNTFITRLAKLSFQPGSEPADDDNTVRIELAQDIHDSFKQLEEDLELLTQSIEDLQPAPTAAATYTAGRRRDSRLSTGEKERERARVSAQVTRLGEDLRSSRGRFRRAQLEAKRASEAAKQREREVLFASLRAPPPQPDSDDGSGQKDLFAGRSGRLAQQTRRKELSRDEQELGASTDVTAALRRTHNLLSTELSRSRFAQETFDQSTAALADLGETYTNVGDILGKSRELLGVLVSSQKSDTWYLETAFYILLATLGWLFFRRVLFGPFVLLPRFFYRLGVFALNWLVLKPLWWIAVGTGVITTSPASARSGGGVSVTQSSSTRAPLIIQPSAKGGIPTFAMADRERLAKGSGVPAGAGGAGAKEGKDPGVQKRIDDEVERRVSERIGEMHEQSEREAKGEGEREGGVRRGDGTVLQERGDKPRNPKKKVFEADVEDERQRQRERDEL